MLYYAIGIALACDLVWFYVFYTHWNHHKSHKHMLKSGSYVFLSMVNFLIKVNLL